MKAQKHCWQCGKRLAPTYETIRFRDSRLYVHKICKQDAENLLLKNKVTFQGQEADGGRMK